jgi:hypothetical protein
VRDFAGYDVVADPYGEHDFVASTLPDSRGAAAYRIRSIWS